MIGAAQACEKRRKGGRPNEDGWQSGLRQEDARDVKKLIEHAYKKGRSDMANEIQSALDANKPPEGSKTNGQ